MRSIGVGALTLAAGGGAELAYDAALCPRQHAWQRVHEDRSAIVRDSGYRFALQDESIYVCETPHRIGPVLLHQDLDCYCAPASAGAAAVGRLLSGDCVVDHAQAARADESGACRHAHCRDLNEWP